MTWLSELSTCFVNFGQILAWHDKIDSQIYFVNGITMFISFLVFRVGFYTYMIFWGIIPFDTNAEENWKMYPASQHLFIYFLHLCYFVMFMLNIYWFSLILMAVLKALGLVADDGYNAQSEKSTNDQKK